MEIMKRREEKIRLSYFQMTLNGRKELERTKQIKKGMYALIITFVLMWPGLLPLSQVIKST